MESKSKKLFGIFSGNINHIISKLMLVSVLFLVVSHFVGSATFTKGFAISLGMAYVDMWILLYGTKKAMAHVTKPRFGLFVFHKYTLVRIINIAVMFYALSKVIRLKDYASGLCMGFLLIHILFILYLIIVTHRLKKTGA